MPEGITIGCLRLMELKQYYTERTTALSGAIRRRKARNCGFVAGEVATFVAFIGFIVLYTVRPDGAWPLWLSALSLVAYLLVRRMDVRNSAATERLQDLLAVNTHELQYLEGDLTPFDDGARYADARHPFTFDLDIFGPGSLFQRVNRTVTEGGSDELAARLRSVCRRGDTAFVNRLAAMPLWREAFMAVGQRGMVGTVAVRRALDTVGRMPLPRRMAGRGVLVVAWAAIVGFAVSIVLAAAGAVSANVPIWWGVLQFFLVFALCKKGIRQISRAVGKLHDPLSRYMRLVALIDDQFHDLGLREARLSFARLDHILGDLDRRGNVLGLFLFDMFLLSDLFIIRRFLQWQRDSFREVARWVDTVDRMDALVSMATFRFNEPEATDAEIVDADGVVFEAQGLWHPFLGAKAVRNDFNLADRHFYIITGANMAGKSTFLRTLGINYVLAMNGMPVFAERLRVSRFHLFTSMRTTDDLTHGISYFNAELLRLRQLIDSLDDSPTLIILDEILKGTNSLDKLNGSRMFLQWIARKNVTGVVATHDLELSKMEGDRFHNYCFEIGLGERVTYSYKITPGVARNQNATYLLRQLLAT